MQLHVAHAHVYTLVCTYLHTHTCTSLSHTSLLQAALAGDAERLQALLDGALEEEAAEGPQAGAAGSLAGQGENAGGSQRGAGHQQGQQQQDQSNQQGAQAAGGPKKSDLSSGIAGRAKTLYDFLHAPCPLAL